MEFRQGMRDSVPIALGYFTICMAFGLHVVTGGFGPWTAGILSASNLSSSGQFAGLAVIVAGGSLVQLALTIVVVNLRYMLMSLSLSQQLAPGSGLLQRLVIAFGITDEIYALAMARGVVGFRYYAGLMPLPILGWTAGGVLGALVGEVLPQSLQAAMGVLLYAMFIAIVVPPARARRPVLAVVAIASITSVCLACLPVVRELEVGWRIILATLIASSAGASMFPVPVKERR